MNQLALNFTRSADNPVCVPGAFETNAQRERRIRENFRRDGLTKEEQRFVDDMREGRIKTLPESLLAEVRCRRRGWDMSFFSKLPVYQRNLELACEFADIMLPGTQYIRPYDPDPALIDACAKREANALHEAFQQFLAAQRGACSTAPQIKKP